LIVIVAVVVGFLVWHATRANQARLGIRSRRGQIKSMWGEIRKFAFRGFAILVIFILLLWAVLRH